MHVRLDLRYFARSKWWLFVDVSLTDCRYLLFFVKIRHGVCMNHSRAAMRLTRICLARDDLSSYDSKKGEGVRMDSAGARALMLKVVRKHYGG